MDRREFLKKGVQAGLLTTATFSIPGFYGSYISKRSYTAPEAYDMVAIKGGEPGQMFDEAIKSFGGMKSFVKKNQKVLIKPNIGWDVSPERGGNTNPELVSRVIKHCFDAGAKEVYVFDHTCDDWRRSYSNSGIEKAVKDAGGQIVSGSSESYYQQVSIKKGKNLNSAEVHINMPILKNHGSTRISVGMKNSMGVVWDRGYWHRNDLHQCIADFATFKRPDLTIVDAYYVMKRNGPRGVSVADVVTMKSQILSIDPVAADSAAAKLFGVEPDNIAYISIADSLGAGKMDLSSLKINRIIL